MDKLPSGHCGFKSAASLSSGAEFLMGGEAMVDGSEVGSGAPLIITKGVHTQPSVFVSPKEFYKNRTRSQNIHHHQAMVDGIEVVSSNL